MLYYGAGGSPPPNLPVNYGKIVTQIISIIWGSYGLEKLSLPKIWN